MEDRREVTAPPRVRPVEKAGPHLIPPDDEEIETTITALQNRSKLPNNARFRNTSDHKYELRSRRPVLITDAAAKYKTLAVNCIMAHEVFKNVVQHIYSKDGKRETIDTIRKGPMVDVWDRALSNEWG